MMFDVIPRRQISYIGALTPSPTSHSQHKYLAPHSLQLHSPNHNGLTLIFFRMMPDAFFPGFIFRTVENNQVAFVYTTHSIHILKGLTKAIGNDFLQRASFDLQFQDDALNRATIANRQRLAYEQVGALTSQTILTVYIPTTINNTLQLGLQQQLGASLGIIELRNPRIAVLTEELLEVC